MIKPLPGYLLVEPIEEEKSGALYLPDEAKDKPMKGKVVACGDPKQIYNGDFGMTTAEIESCPVNKNDIVYYKKWINETISENGKEFLFVKFEELLGIEE